jgi:RNA polymerase sigma factor (sigma-70 family)
MKDLEFVQRCTSGDKTAWDEFVEKYSRLIYKYIHSVLKIKGQSAPYDKAQADDIFQDIFVFLAAGDFRKLRSFRGQNNCTLASWLRQVTVNYTIDHLRRIKQPVSLDAQDEEGHALKESLIDKSQPASEIVLEKERLEQLSGCIDILSPEEQYFIELHINQGLAIEELCRYFKASRGAIDMRKNRIIERLRRCFEAKGFLLDF